MDLRKQISSFSVMTVFSIGFAGSPVLAQELARDAGPQPVDIGVTVDIVVTAEKRVQRLVDVPSAVTVVGSAQLRDNGAKTLVDVSQLTAGVLATPQSGGGQMPTFTIRGIGFDDIRPNGNPASAVIIDGVYQGSSALAGGQLFDVDRIEILKGPQGTLYGQNSTAGVVNILSQSPGDTLDGYVRADYSRFNSHRIEAAAGGPLSDNAGLRVSALYSRTDGYQTNIGTGSLATFTPNPAVPPVGNPGRDEHAAKTEFAGGRAVLEMAPDEHLKLRLNVHGFHEDGASPQSRRITPFRGAPVNQQYEFDSNIDPYQKRDNYGGSVNLQYELTNDVSLIAIAGYESLKQNYLNNTDNVPLRNSDIEYRDRVHQGYFEARIQSSDTRRLFWTGGVTAFKDTIKLKQTANVTDALRAIIYGDYKQGRRSLGVFGDGSLKLGSSTKIGLGVRYSDDKSDFSGLTSATNPYSVSLIPIVIPSLPYQFSRHFTDSSISGRIFISQELSKSGTVYGSVRRGYKSGGFDATTPLNDGESTPFQSEKVWTYEVGAKFLPPAAAFQIEAAAFINDYTDLQANALKVFFGDLVGSVRTNVGAASTWGAEVSATLRPVKSLNVQVGAAYLGTKINKVVSADPAESARRIRSQLPYAPPITVFSTVNFHFSVSEHAKIKAIVSGRLIDDYYSDLDNFYKVKGYLLGNARLELEFASGFYVAGWVRNFTDQYYTFSGSRNGANADERPGEPRTYGISVGQSF